MKMHCGLLDVPISALQQLFQVYAMKKNNKKTERGENPSEGEIFCDEICQQLLHLAGSRAETVSGGKGTSTESLLSHMRVLQNALCLSPSICGPHPPPLRHIDILVQVMTHNLFPLSTQLQAEVV